MEVALHVTNVKTHGTQELVPSGLAVVLERGCADSFDIHVAQLQVYDRGDIRQR